MAETIDLPAAIQAFSEADAAWWAELQRYYGTRACEARYDGRRNRRTPTLAALDDARTTAQAIYNRAWQQRHDEVRKAAREEA